MSDEHFSLFEGTQSQRMALVGEVTILMLKGAGYAAVFCLAMWGGFAALTAAGGLLPAESQDALDPTPWSHLDLAPSELAYT